MAGFDRHWVTLTIPPPVNRARWQFFLACTGANNQACAWQYGWDMADLDAQARGVPDPGRYRWWLDVETLNSWESSSLNNRADLEGMVSYFHRIGATAGIYSTAKQWDPIVGPVPSTSPL